MIILNWQRNFWKVIEAGRAWTFSPDCSGYATGAERRAHLSGKRAAPSKTPAFVSLQKKCFYLTVISLFCSGIIAAQSISSSSFSTTGGSFSNDEHSIHFSMGEALNTETSEGNLRISQGLIQYLLTELPSDIASFHLEEIAVYPNPTTAFFTIENEKAMQNLKYAIYTMNGKEIQSAQNLSQLKTIVAVESLPAGSYILKISKDNHYFQNLNLIKF